MRYERVVDYDFNNGDGIGVSLWVTGCPHKCDGCHNSQLFDPNRGQEGHSSALEKIFKALEDPKIDKHLSILGGEPLAPYNIDGVIEVLKAVRKKYPYKEIWLWTGYTIDELDTKQMEVIPYLDYIIDGRFNKNLKVRNKWYGSSNQRLIKLK